MKRPNKKSIKKIVEWLESVDILLYGPSMNVETGEEFNALMDYNVDEVIKRYTHIKKDTLFTNVTI